MRNDRTLGLTVVSAIAPGWTGFARLVFDVLPRTPWGGNDDLERLSFIQSARWAVITGLPHAQGTRRLRYDYLLFESNYNGTFESYLEAFADILGPRMRLIWNSSLGFPNDPVDARLPRLLRLRKRIPGRDFVRYVQSLSHPWQHFHCAYPHASNTEVLAGLQADRVVSELRGLALRPTSTDAARHDLAAHFEQAYRSGLNALQPRPELAAQPVDARGDRRGVQYAFTALLPITPTALGSVRTTLDGLPTGPDSPFAAVPGMHFARLVIIDEITRQPGQLPDAWPQPYLLLTTTTDGPEPPCDRLFDHLGPARDQIFGGCEGYPGTELLDESGHGAAIGLRRTAFTAYLMRHRLPTNRFYGGYPLATVAAVRSGLNTHQRLLDFASRRSGATARQLLDAFTREFVAGPQEDRS